MTVLQTVAGRASDLNSRYDIAYFPLGAAAFGGAERSILELAAAQQAAGKRVLLCYEAALDATDFLDQARELGLQLLRVDWAPEASLATVARSAWQFFRQLNARLIHFNISWRQRMWCIPVIARLATGAKLVGTMRAMPEPYSDLPHGTYLGFVPGLRLAALPDYVVGRVWARSLHSTVSVNRDDYPPRLVRAFGFPAARLSVIYNGVRVPAQMPTAHEREAARTALGLDAAAFVVAYVGRVSPEKGVRYLLEAVARCNRPMELVIAGDGGELAAMRELAGSLGLVSVVRFLGYVSPASQVFTAADVVVVPSLWNEAFGRVVVEAMACGAVVIASAVGGMQEIFEHRKQGLLVPKADVDAIARALDELAADPDFRNRLAEAGFAQACQTYSTDRVCKQYSTLYTMLLK